MDEYYQARRENIEAIFIDENRRPDTADIQVSPCGEFQLETCLYSTGPDSHSYARGIVTRVSDQVQIADIKRNFSHFWHRWISHPNGNQYLLAGEDYQGYGVVNLGTGVSQHYFPPEGHRGLGFCWTGATPSPDGLVLAVDGCIWAAPWELVLFDFREPEQLPYPELARVDYLEKEIGWKENEAFVLLREVCYRKSDGKPYAELTEQEQDELDDFDSLVDFRSEEVELIRPPFE